MTLARSRLQGVVDEVQEADDLGITTHRIRGLEVQLKLLY